MILGGKGGSQKTNIEGEGLLKKEGWTVSRFKGEAWPDKKEGVVFLSGGLIPQCTL